MDNIQVLKALADKTRMQIITLLLKHNYCVKALATLLKQSESSISQHLKVLRQANLISENKRGYYKHYQVNCSTLKQLTLEIESLTKIKNEECIFDKQNVELDNCPNKGNCHSEIDSFCQK